MYNLDFNTNNYYKLIAPRPTVCVSTIDENGISNVAPYSFATPLSFNPPLIGISVGKGKDTIQNAKKSGDFVVAPLTKSWMREGIKSEISVESDISEFEEAELTESESGDVKSPSIKEAPVNIECVYEKDLETGDHQLLVGKVVNISAKENAIKDNRINLEKLGSVGHITGEEFSVTNNSVLIDRK